MKIKVLVVFGTRPEAIKMAPVIKELKNDSFFDTKVCVTAQHREMLDQVLEFFNINADYDLNLMRPQQNLFNLTALIINELKPVLEDFNPNYVLVHGDTTTTMASSIAAFYNGSKVCHVEAGLRTFNKKSPFPEEMNRVITGHIADYHFAPTETSFKNLVDEKINKDTILITGNTVIDALIQSVEKVNSIDFSSPEIDKLKKIIKKEKNIILVTGHRRENHGMGFINICKALKQISEEAENVQIIYPVHLNPNVQKPVYDLLSDNPNINLVDPLPYEAFVWLMDKSKLIITDSGGVQEEAPSIGKPVLVMRDTTERPEAVEAGTVILVGTHTEKIVKEALALLQNESKYKEMSLLHNPYGNGDASAKILNFLKQLNE
ncbi:MAG: non-hydrolyzing UDP-N-acetylglucosamine 2-epimerase [Flavobacteriia bacterium]|jgi:UDP-N-acetylglucosamine 2-epimerase (non-hydrolysing)